MQKSYTGELYEPYWSAKNNSLESANFTALASLQNVGDHWLSDCGSLKSVDFNLAELQCVGNGWLSLCHSLETVDFAALSGLQRVGDRWLDMCNSLMSVHFVGLDNN